ncbi:hypothetical protein HF086_006399 [Spodoptera exigua]|uniref:Uncharacterized protein n=1 Tax=Spodoptera exigua TaxID=7107 RepID=A0A922SNX0_SPOEX|nr:hypothetical protein HF086_006399 [Spodoptera exigua]
MFNLPVLYRSSETFILGLIKAQVLISFLHYYSINPDCGIPIIQGMLYIVIMKYLLLQNGLSYHIEEFYSAIKMAQDSCSLILGSRSTDEEKKLCRNIQRLHRVLFSKMKPFGLFYEDIRHTLRVFELLTNYIVVLLQFALL